ncbi:MAG: Fic family protein, partial [Pseudomonadota bacterium]
GEGYGLETLIEGVRKARTRQDLAEAGVALPDYLVRKDAGVQFPPHDTVNKLLEEWIYLFNQIDHSSTLHQIAYLYRNYQFIHPYVDAEGRTARALLDLMLARAGYGVLSHNQATSMIFYLTLDELAMRLQSQLIGFEGI